MRTFPALRNRSKSDSVQFDPAAGTISRPIPSGPPREQTAVSGAMSRIVSGLFGKSTPKNTLDAQVPEPGPKAMYHFHEGDLFTPGAQNFVLDPFQELPLQTIWGHAFLRQPNSFQPIPPTPVSFIPPGTSFVRIAGIGGLVAGQVAFQPLMNNGD